jgi:hypothetical protein
LKGKGEYLMKKFFVALVLALGLAASAQASTMFSGQLGSSDDVQTKIEELKDLILYSYQRSGLTMWAPFYYWKCKGDDKCIYYCYTLLPIGERDEEILHKVINIAVDAQTEPIYVPVRIVRAGGMRS